MRRIVSGFTLSGLTLALNLAGQLLSVPILMAHWGIRTYGAWIALTNLASGITLMNLGIQSYVTNQLILMTSRGRHKEAARLFGSALKVYAVFCVAALGMMAAGLCWLSPSSLVDAGGMSRTAASGVVLAHALLAIYGIFGGVWINLLRVGGQLPLQLAYGLAERTIILAVPVAAAICGAGPVYASWSMICVLGVAEIVIARGVYRRAPIRISPSAGSLREGFRLVGPSLFFFGSSLSSQLATTGVTLVISNVAGAVAVATFATAMALTNLFRMILNQAVNVLSGEITLLLGREELARLRQWYGFLCKASLSAAVASAVVLCPLGPYVVSLWTRGQVQVDFQLNFLLAMYLVAHAAGIVSLGFGLAMNRQRPVFFVQLGAGVGALALSAVLVRAMGLHGVAWGLLVTQILATTALTLLNCRWIGQPAGRLLLDAIGRGFPTFVVAAAGIAAGHGLLAFAGCLLLTWFTWFTAWERNWLWNQCGFSLRGTSVPLEAG